MEAHDRKMYPLPNRLGLQNRPTAFQQRGKIPTPTTSVVDMKTLSVGVAEYTVSLQRVKTSSMSVLVWH